MRARGISTARYVLLLSLIVVPARAALAQVDAPALWGSLIPGVLYQDLAFSPDGKLVAGGTEAGLCRLFNADDGSTVKDLPAVDGLGLVQIAFSPDSSLLAEVQTDGHVLIFDVESTRSKFVGSLLEASVALRFSEDGSKLVACGRSGAVMSWSADGAQPRVMEPFKEAAILQKILPDGDRAVATFQDGKVLVRTFGSDKPLVFSPGAGPVVGFTSTPDGQVWGIGVRSRSLLVVDGQTQKELRQWPIPGEPWEIALARDGSGVLAAPRTPPAQRTPIVYCDVKGSAPPQQLVETVGNISRLEMHPDGAGFGTITKDHRSMTVRRLANRKPLPLPLPSVEQTAAVGVWREWIVGSPSTDSSP